MVSLTMIVALAAAVSAHPYSATTTKAISTTAKHTSTTTKYTSSTSKSSTTTSPSACATAARDATFDDIAVVPAVEINPIPVPYMGLDFQGFQVLGVVETDLAPGVIPHSGTQYAYSNVLTTTTGGSAEWTTNYPGSAVKSFTPSSFYYGCALNLGQGAAAVPTACNIAITGFAVGDNTAETVQVASQQFSYNPSTSLGATQMALGTFNSAFKNLQYVLVQYTLPGGSAALGSDLALVIDDVRYSTCS